MLIPCNITDITEYISYTYDKGLITVNDLANAISTYCFVGSNLTNNYVVNDQPVQV